MQYEKFVEWIENNILENVKEKLNISKSNDSFIVSRLTGFAANPEPQTFISVKYQGNFIGVYIYPDTQQDSKFVAALESKYKNQLKAMYGAITFVFLDENANSLSQQIFSSELEEAKEFLIKYKEKMVWELPLKKGR